MVFLQKKVCMTREMHFFKNHAENEARILVTDLFFFKKKNLYDAKQVVYSLVSIHFDSSWHTIKTSCIKL